MVAELRALRLAGEERRTSIVPDVEIELIQSLRVLLEKLFSPKRRNFVERKIRDIQRRISQLFFNSELYAELAADAGEVPAAAWPEQALYYALKLHEEKLLDELRAIPVENEAVRARAIDRLNMFTRQLCTDFLSRTTPELERLLAIYREVLADFFYADFGAALGELCWEVVKESRVAEGHQLGYKIKADKFPDFRAAFDKHFLERLVFHVQDPIVKRAGGRRSVPRGHAALRGGPAHPLGDLRRHQRRGLRLPAGRGLPGPARRLAPRPAARLSGWPHDGAGPSTPRASSRSRSPSRCTRSSPPACTRRGRAPRSSGATTRSSSTQGAACSEESSRASTTRAPAASPSSTLPTSSR
ncbi:MAG: hypothetical protein M5U28_34735 [Sandaracinaceae bacterium]|nr:hypothetical protein [Sandaracinaceae bacterium]